VPRKESVETLQKTLQAVIAELRRGLPWRDRLRSAWRRRRAWQLVDCTNGLVPDCARCRDHCCKAPHEVELRLDDVARLRDAGLGHALLYPEPGRLALYREPTLAKKPDGTCVFFGADGRCEIYALRPIVCRRFPYAIAQDAKTLSYSTSCRASLPGDAAMRRDLRAAALDSYNARIFDRMLVRRARRALVALGLIGSSGRDRFNEVLHKRTR
jgi:Fe-S-cluster containining protein